MDQNQERKVISKEVAKGQQDVVFKEILVTGGLRLRVDIRSDAYDFQSHARIDVFRPADLKWNHLASIHYSVMTTPHKLYYKLNGTDEQWFLKDRNELVRQATEILNQA